MKPRVRTRRPGRPPAGRAGDTRRDLLAAARRLFTQRGYAQVSLRSIAKAAGLNPAMIHYHFGGKRELYEAMLRQVMDPVLQQVDRVAETPQEPSAALDRLIHEYIRVLTANPWLPHLIVRDILAVDSELRDMFVERFASRGPRIAQLFARGTASGEYRRDLDPILATLSMMSMLLFPFVALPVVSRALDIELDEALVERLAGHTETLLLRGIVSAEAET